MNLNNVKHWLLIISKFLVSQGIIKFIDLATAILILRLLPITEYALYTIFSLLFLIGSLGSDLGLSQALISLGARFNHDSVKLGSLFITAKKYRHKLYLISSVIMLILTPIITRGQAWALSSIVLCVLILLLSTWLEQTISLRNSILNIHHDSKSLFCSGIITSIIRFALTLTICRIVPTTVTALAINLSGYLINNLVLQLLCKQYINEKEAVSSPEHKKDFSTFIYPLIPGAIYFIIQGQVSIFLLSLFGHITPIAQVGALGRLGQIIGFIMMIQPFFIQPYFARLENKKDFTGKTLFTVLILLLGTSITLISSFIFPQAWLYLLGNHYSNLTHELPIALAAPLVFLISTTLYTIVISHKFTQWQSFSIIISIVIQLLFIIIKGIHTALDALLLNLFINVGYLILQLILIIRFLYLWKINTDKLKS